MSRFGLNHLLIILATVVLFAPVPLCAKDAGSNQIISTLAVSTPVSIGGTMLKPGTYTVKADDTRVTLSANGKTVAQASVQWKNSDKKSESTSVLAENGSVKEIHFSGKTRYVEISD